MRTIAALGVLSLTLILASFSTPPIAAETGAAPASRNATGVTGFSYRPPSRGSPVSRVGGGSRGAAYLPPSRGAPASRVGGGSRGAAYLPPSRGAPASRVGGGSRATGLTPVKLSVIAPEHTGLTTRNQPTLYWYLSRPVDARLDVTVIDDRKIDPLLEQVIGIPESAGIQSLDLASVGTALEPGIEYRWFVSLTPDEKQRSSDIVASGTIEYSKPDAALEKRIAGADELAMARIYAEDGIWYDAIDSLSLAIQQNPEDSGLHAQRAALLEQVGLDAAAAYDRER